MKTLALISGGPDSVFLFYFLRQRGESFEVLHFNHHLRGEESDGEQCFVEALCRKFGVFCHVRHLAIPTTGNMQALAREERLKACFALQQTHGVGRIITAHHRDDWLETLLMRQRRGAGLAGFAGIRYRTRLHYPGLEEAFLEVCRPLLNRRKDELIAYLTAHGFEFCIDSSNASPRYERNRLRASLRNREAPEEIFMHAALLQGIDSYFAARADWLTRAYPYRVPPGVWLVWPEELKFRMFSHLMRKAGYQKQIERKHFALIQNRRHVKLVLDRAVFRKNRDGCNFSSLPVTAV